MEVFANKHLDSRIICQVPVPKERIGVWARRNGLATTNTIEVVGFECIHHAREPILGSWRGVLNSHEHQISRGHGDGQVAGRTMAKGFRRYLVNLNPFKLHQEFDGPVCRS